MTELEQDISHLERHKVMSLWEHLDELRTRIIRSLIASIVCMAILLYFSQDLVHFLVQPLAKTLPAGTKPLHFVGPLDVFMLYLKIGMYGGFILSMPVWIYQFWRFLEPALHEHEKKYVKPFASASILLFVSGVSFCYFYIAPITFEWSMSLAGKDFQPIITVTEYFSMLMMMIFGFGFLFEAPLVLIMLSLLDLIKVDTIAKNRGFIIVGIFVVAAVLTPPDPFSQTALALPIWLMMEVSLFIMRRIERRRGQGKSSTL